MSLIGYPDEGGLASTIDGNNHGKTITLLGCQSDAGNKSLSAKTEFDLVILSGRVMDPETNFDGIRNVGVLNGKIALITEAEISRKETIAATGHASGAL